MCNLLGALYSLSRLCKVFLGFVYYLDVCPLAKLSPPAPLVPHLCTPFEANSSINDEELIKAARAVTSKGRGELLSCFQTLAASLPRLMPGQAGYANGVYNKCTPCRIAALKLVKYQVISQLREFCLYLFVLLRSSQGNGLTVGCEVTMRTKGRVLSLRGHRYPVGATQMVSLYSPAGPWMYPPQSELEG